MQERYAESAVFQEAIYKLHHIIVGRPEGFHYGNTWESYAQEFAPDANPDEVESFVRHFPPIDVDQKDTLVRLPASHVVQWYGALALHSAGVNQPLHEHSLQAITSTQAHLERTHQQSSVSREAVNQLLAVYCQTNNLDKVLPTADQYATTLSHMQNYLRHAISTLDQHNIPVPAEDSFLWQTANVLAMPSDDNNDECISSLHSEAIASCMARLYGQTDKNALLAYAKTNAILPEFVRAAHQAGEAVDASVFMQAVSTALSTRTNQTLGELAAQADAPAQRRIRKLAWWTKSNINYELFKKHLFMAKALQAAHQGDFVQAFAYSKKSKFDLATRRIEDTIIANGDPVLYQAVCKTNNRRARTHSTFSDITAPMFARAGNLEAAVEAINNDNKTMQYNGWSNMLQAHIQQEIARNSGDDIKVDHLMAFVEQSCSPHVAKWLGNLFADCYRAFGEAGRFDLAKDIREKTLAKFPDFATEFGRQTRDVHIMEVITSGNWLEAMHGPHLAHPDEGLGRAEHLLLVAGGIHHERLRRAAVPQS